MFKFSLHEIFKWPNQPLDYVCFAELQSWLKKIRIMCCYQSNTPYVLSHPIHLKTCAMHQLHSCIGFNYCFV